MIQRGPKPFDVERADGEVFYPDGDGKPMAESDIHFTESAEFAVPVLKAYFADRPDVSVHANNFLYWEKGDPSSVVSPDAYVVFGVVKKPRRSYKVWEEGGQRPCFVLEISSESTRRHDLGDKLVTYRDDLEVPDYFIFDPLGEWLPERLRGYRLAGGEYARVKPDPATGRLPSLALGLELAAIDGHLRFFRPGEAEPIPTPVERAASAQREAASAQREAASAQREAASAQREAASAEARAAAAEAEVAHLRAELARLRAKG